MSADPHPLELFVRTFELRTPLSGSDRQQILALPYTLRTLESGSYVVREADAPRYCGVLVSGFAYRQKLTGEGARQIIAINLPGEAIDLQHLFLREADHSVQMLTRGEVAFVAREDLQALVRGSSAISHALLVQMQVEASIFREWVLNVGRRPAKSRLAHVLCELAVRLDAVGLAAHYGYQLPMTQEELADALGLTPVHVNRTIKSLEADKLIARDRRRLFFPEWKRLRDVGDFNARYLHLNPLPSSE